jgi:hypothetical protein
MAQVFPEGYPRPMVCVECNARPIEAPSVIYCGECAPKIAADDAKEEAYYAEHPDERPSIYPDEPGSVGGI